MSVIQSLIKQAFGTGNSNEAASFLASACNRMKAMDKTTIAREVESALKGVSFGRTDADKAKVKTVLKTPPSRWKDWPHWKNRFAASPTNWPLRAINRPPLILPVVIQKKSGE